LGCQQGWFPKVQSNRSWVWMLNTKSRRTITGVYRP
jgi:hypothetical protein